MDRTMKIFTTMIALAFIAIIAIGLMPGHIMGEPITEPEVKTTIIEKELTVEIMETYSTINKYFAYVEGEEFKDIIEISEEEFNLWEKGDTISIGVGFTYTL